MKVVLIILVIAFVGSAVGWCSAQRQVSKGNWPQGGEGGSKQCSWTGCTPAGLPAYCGAGLRKSGQTRCTFSTQINVLCCPDGGSSGSALESAVSAPARPVRAPAPAYLPPAPAPAYLPPAPAPAYLPPAPAPAYLPPARTPAPAYLPPKVSTPAPAYLPPSVPAWKSQPELVPPSPPQPHNPTKGYWDTADTRCNWPGCTPRDSPAFCAAAQRESGSKDCTDPGLIDVKCCL